MGFVLGCFPAVPGFPGLGVLFQSPGSLSRIALAFWIVLTVLLHLPSFWVALHWTASLPSNTCSAHSGRPSPPHAWKFTCPDGPAQCRNVILETLSTGNQAEILPNTIGGLVLTQVKTNKQTNLKVTRGSAFSPYTARGRHTEPCRWSLPAQNMLRKPEQKWIFPHPGNSPWEKEGSSTEARGDTETCRPVRRPGAGFSCCGEARRGVSCCREARRGVSCCEGDLRGVSCCRGACARLSAAPVRPPPRVPLRPSPCSPSSAHADEGWKL